jgi:ATPase subunit of ABC transporter with duplicated ATPase domains
VKTSQDKLQSFPEDGECELSWLKSFAKPDLILLDEPTNHMDIESIQWLEDFLINSAKAVVVISHDRTFVDNITNRTIEVTMGRMIIKPNILII